MTDEADTPENETGATADSTPDSSADRPAPRRRSPAGKPAKRPESAEAATEDKAAGPRKTKPGKKKISTRKMVIFGVLGVLALLVFYGMQPVQGTIRYGICKVFIEMRLRYPNSMQVNMVEEYASLVRMYYSAIDAFGSSQLHMVECEFSPDPTTGFRLNAVRINRDEVPEAEIIPFNATIPFIIQNPPDLRRPSFRSDSLADLKISYN